MSKSRFFRRCGKGVGHSLKSKQEGLKPGFIEAFTEIISAYDPTDLPGYYVL
jgi:hypothetical protein